MQGASDLTQAEREELVERLVVAVIGIERKYGHELRNVKTEKYGQIRDVIETLSRGEP